MKNKEKENEILKSQKCKRNNRPRKHNSPPLLLTPFKTILKRANQFTQSLKNEVLRNLIFMTSETRIHCTIIFYQI